MAQPGWTRRGAIAAASAAAAACGRQVETPAYAGVASFAHGVASGDPAQDRVIIWTRVTPDRAGPVPVRWIVARNRQLTDVVKTGVVEANEARDYTVKVDVTGLRAGAPYFYGFRAGNAESAIGKTRTLPRGRLRELKLAVACCASYPHGFFNAYAAIAERGDVDVVIHLGDYIYEYGLAGLGPDGRALGRTPAPDVECVRLEDYRQRHAQYKTEAELQAAHAAAPWIVVWDDHETANDSWTGGAENHQPSEGEWANRKRAALQAYYEWMPIRDPEPGRAFEAINRAFQFGDLATLIMLETRLLARTQPLDFATQLPIELQRWDFTNPSAPVALRAGEPDTPSVQRAPAIYEDVGGELRPVLDWRRAQSLATQLQNLPRGFYAAPDVGALNAMLSTPDRALLGAAQQSWLAEQLTQSKTAGAVWQLLGNQVLMAPVTIPDLSAESAAGARLEGLRPGITQLLKLTRFPFPLNAHGWDGYPQDRARVLASLRAAGANALVLSGDTHVAWANEISDAEGRVAAELGAPSVTSPSEADYLDDQDRYGIAARIRARNAHVKWVEPHKRGYLLVTLTKQQALAEFFAVSTVTAKQYETVLVAAFSIAPTPGAPITPV